MGIRVRTLQLGWLGVDHELVLFPHPDPLHARELRRYALRWDYRERGRTIQEW